ncbi:hypothetical protein BH11PSE10_BH11PSE10_08720 [soil metagenome]
MIDSGLGHADAVQGAVRAARVAGLLEGWRVTEPAPGASELNGSGEFWCQYVPPDPVAREAGFKIHLSASLACAAEVLAAVIPVLARRGVPFKHAASLRHLAFLSSGGGGYSQIGKFITVYPRDVAGESELAQALHAATRHLQGPRIPSEPVLVAGSLVHFRYGGFETRWLQLRSGQIVPARLGEQGLEPDPRGSSPPSSTGNNSLLAAAASEGVIDEPLLRQRYLRVQRLHRGPKGSTWLGFEVGCDSTELLVIKQAQAHVMEGSDGMDARDRLAREAQCLQLLARSGVTPRPRDFWVEPQRAVLVYTLVEGPTFDAVLAGLAAQGLRPPPAMLRSWWVALCTAVSSVHRLGLVVGDLKPANLVLVGERFELIDLELAGPPTTAPSGTMGTRGYASAQQLDAACGRSLLDDIHALGATMLAAATLTDAALLPDCRAVAELECRRHPGDALFETLVDCLATDPRERPQSTDEILARLTRPAATRETPRRNTARIDPMALAVSIGDGLLRDARPCAEGLYWISQHPTVSGQPGRDLYAGSAGTALFLCALFEATGEARWLDAAGACAQWLWSTPPAVPRLAPMHGLYFGESGCGWLYLQLAKLSGDGVWLARSRAVSRRAAASRPPSPDLLTGMAGTGLFHLALWHATQAPSALNRAASDAAALLAARCADHPGWVMPEGYDSLSGREFIGFAHGAAGIGYFLAECCLARPEAALAAACREIARSSIALARPCLADQSGLAWPVAASDPALHAAHWCHGSTGMARFLLRAFEAMGDPAYLHAARAACRTVALGPQWLGTTQCHGLASNLEVLIDLWQVTGEPGALRAAHDLGERLATYRGDAGWPSEHPFVHSPDLMVGQAGIGAAFLRLADPRRPQLLSTAAMSRHRMRQAFGTQGGTKQGDGNA